MLRGWNVWYGDALLRTASPYFFHLYYSYFIHSMACKNWIVYGEKPLFVFIYDSSQAIE